MIRQSQLSVSCPNSTRRAAQLWMKQLLDRAAAGALLLALLPPLLVIAVLVRLSGPGDWQRLTVKPGLTGLWQVSGRNELDFQQMVELDLRYIARSSLWLDIQILLRTPLVVLTGRGAS